MRRIAFEKQSFQKSFARWGGVSVLAGAAMAACWFAITSLPILRAGNLVLFLAYFTIACLAYLMAVWRLARDRLPLSLIWGLALLFRLVLLASPLALSDDIYRYLWDGRLLSQGVTPYAWVVDDPVLDAYETPLRASVNHAWMASPYLPAAQAVFAVVERIAPQNIMAYRILAILLDLAVGWLVMGLFGLFSLPRRRVLIYLWSPLVVIEFAHSAHIDVWMLFLILLSFWLLARARPGSAAENRWLSASVISFGAAVLTKGIPLLLTPLFLRRWGWRRWLLFALIVILPLAWFAAGAGWGLTGVVDGTGVFGATRIYLRQWNYNSGFYHWLEVALTGYRTEGAVPLQPDTETGILWAKLITSGLLGCVLLGALFWAWKLDDPAGNDHHVRTLGLIRLAILPLSGYLLLAATLHPWYVIIILPFIPFLLPKNSETPLVDRLIWPWLYFSCAIGFSYLTYINPLDLHEYALIRWVEYPLFYALLLWSVWPGLRRMVDRLAVK